MRGVITSLWLSILLAMALTSPQKHQGAMPQESPKIQFDHRSPLITIPQMIPQIPQESVAQYHDGDVVPLGSPKIQLDQHSSLVTIPQDIPGIPPESEEKHHEGDVVPLGSPKIQFDHHSSLTTIPQEIPGIPPESEEKHNEGDEYGKYITYDHMQREEEPMVENRELSIPSVSAPINSTRHLKRNFPSLRKDVCYSEWWLFKEHYCRDGYKCCSASKDSKCCPDARPQCCAGYCFANRSPSYSDTNTGRRCCTSTTHPVWTKGYCCPSTHPVGCGQRKCCACKCGKTNPQRIVGGVQVSPARKYPWQVGLQKPGHWISCGGSIINDLWILTAAHCLYKDCARVVDASNPVYVWVGEHVQLDTSEDVFDTYKYSVKTYVPHDNYNCQTLDNDVALLELKDRIFFNKIRPICLPSDDTEDYVGFDAIVTGWGRTSDAEGTQSKFLQEVEVPILANDKCGNWGTLSSNKLCAGGETGKDFCKGDSGGPLVVYQDNKYVQVGIVSYYGGECASTEYPGIYARVSEFIPWIAEKTANGKFCD